MASLMFKIKEVFATDLMEEFGYYQVVVIQKRLAFLLWTINNLLLVRVPLFLKKISKLSFSTLKLTFFFNYYNPRLAKVCRNDQSGYYPREAIFLHPLGQHMSTLQWTQQLHWEFRKVHF